MMRTALSLLFVAVGLCGCGVAYEQNRSEILRSASTEAFGPPPPANYRGDGEAFIKRRLKDPENARFEWVGEPRREAIQPVFASARATPVWITNVRVKAKNDFGGFTGFESLFTLAWKKGKIVAYSSSTFPIWAYVQSGVGTFGDSLAKNTPHFISTIAHDFKKIGNSNDLNWAGASPPGSSCPFSGL